MLKTFLQLKFGPATLNLPSLVGQPIYQGSVIGLDKASDVELLTGDDNNFHTVYEDGSTRNWFVDITDAYTKGKKAKPSATVEPAADGEEEEEEGEGDGEGDAQATADGVDKAADDKPAAAGQRKRVAGPTAKSK